MNDASAVLAGRIEDKWIEFVAAEFADRAFGAGRRRRRDRLAGRWMRVEVRASYVWLLAGAILTWFLR